MQLTPNAQLVLERRFLRKDQNGRPIETISEMFWRVANTVAAVETIWSENTKEIAEQFYEILQNFLFLPNSPTFTGAGTPLGQLAACFVLPISDDMGRKKDGIFSTLRVAALIQQTGGGNGFSFSRLRPKGALVKTSAGQASGPVGFLRVYDKAFGEVAQGGTRRGANMAVLRCDHPDIEEFITCKTDENAITNFNISVGITDAFMQAVLEDDEWQLRFPDVQTPDYSNFQGTLEQARVLGLPIKVHKRVQARELLQKIARQAHRNGEPGVLFLDTANRQNPVPHLYELEATNPCGEQWLGPYENCCLGHINLARHLDANRVLDWDKLAQTVRLATRFLDDVVDANKYVPAVPKLEESAKACRRIGLGIMGLGDVFYALGVRYGSEISLELAGQIMEFIRFHSLKESICLAQVRGAFPAIKGSIYDPQKLEWEPPKPLTPDTHDFGRPLINWGEITGGIRHGGIRNSAQTTIAPTGTVGTVASCEAYGCEPVFALAYVRYLVDPKAGGGDGRTTLTYHSPLFEKALTNAGLDSKMRKHILEQVAETGSCQNIPEVPEDIRQVFVVAGDISVEEHVRMQAALQAFVDSSISKTVNAPANTTPEDIIKAYQLAWELGCKGLTVYVTGSREKVVLETKDMARTDQTLIAPQPRSRQPVLAGKTYRIPTPVGTAFVTINNWDGYPYEVFVNVGKGGSDTAAMSEALGRLISLALQVPSTLSPTERVSRIVDQLRGIGGRSSLGFGNNRVRSLPDAVAAALLNHINLNHQNKSTGETPKGDLCPRCGQTTFIQLEGCTRCLSCGHSEC